MEKSKEALSGSDEGDNHVEPIPKSSSHSSAYPEESLEGMEERIGSITLTVSSESVETSEHIVINVEAPNDFHLGGSDRSGPENSNCSQMKDQKCCKEIPSMTSRKGSSHIPKMLGHGTEELQI